MTRKTKASPVKPASMSGLITSASDGPSVDLVWLIEASHAAAGVSTFRRSGSPLRYLYPNRPQPPSIHLPTVWLVGGDLSMV